MTRKFLCLLLFSSLLPLGALTQGCAKPSCSQYAEQLAACEDKVLADFGDKQEATCKRGEANQCTAGQICTQPPGEAFASCYTPGEALKNFKEMLTVAQRLCDDVFAGRQKKYMDCVVKAGCNIKDANKCTDQLVSLKKQTKQAGQFGGFLASFAAFLIASIFFGGLMLFVLLKLTDRANPKNTIPRAIFVSIGIGLFTFPLVYASPLLGIFISSSILFGAVMIVYQQGAFLSTALTASHIVWVQLFFTFIVSAEVMHGPAWISQAEFFRIQIVKQHETVAKSISDIEGERKRYAEAKKRAAEEEKKRKEEEAAAKKKAEEEAKKKAEEEKKE